MANSSITTVQYVYKRVIDDTIKNSRETFLNEGIEESVLQELRTLWESKVSSTKAVEPAINPPDYIQRNQIYKYQFSRNQHSNAQATGNTVPVATNVRFPGGMSAFIPQPQPLNQRHQPLAARPQSLHNPGGGPSSSSVPQFQPTIPFPAMSGVTTVSKKEFNNASANIQVDGACDVIPGTDDVTNCGKSKGKLLKKTKKKSRGCIILQVDGGGGGDSDEDVGEFVDSDDTDDDDDNDDTDGEIDVGGDRGTDMRSPGIDLNDLNRPSTPLEDDDPLNTDDDVSDDNISEDSTENVVVCLFEKVNRSKNKWKLYLKEGVMNIGGKDHVFQKAVGDGEW